MRSSQAPPTTNLASFPSAAGPRSSPRPLGTFQLLAIAVPAQDRRRARPRDQAAEFHLAALHCLLSDLHHRILRSHCAEKGRAREGSVRRGGAPKVGSSQSGCWIPGTKENQGPTCGRDQT